MRWVFAAADVELLDTSTLEAVTRGKPPTTDFERARNVRVAVGQHFTRSLVPEPP
eukprot:m.1118366 g.1118366  ORF g.1118366 m.1118366 type:complete len:55 (+) comp24385_c0_seq3:2448-2612(+)